ncbi:MAG TPA: hypothetical protein VFX16_06175 [Pseudonocardiaceae bacterium]|nr:hypothetical protein [Pseudonocardiaceae bacterium]
MRPDDAAIPMNGVTAGIRSPTRPDRWLVPPWKADAGICDVVEHFMRFEPWHSTETNTANLLAYYRGFARALHTASTGQLLGAADWQWFEALRALVVRCADAYQQERPNRERDLRDMTSRLLAS